MEKSADISIDGNISLFSNKKRFLLRYEPKCNTPRWLLKKVADSLQAKKTQCKGNKNGHNFGVEQEREGVECIFNHEMSQVCPINGFEATRTRSSLSLKNPKVPRGGYCFWPFFIDSQLNF